jgi:hypothetical protein
MDVPLWLALIVIGALGVKLIRPPWWLVAVLSARRCASLGGRACP